MKTLQEHTKGQQQQSACAQANQMELRTAANPNPLHPSLCCCPAAAPSAVGRLQAAVSCRHSLVGVERGHAAPVLNAHRLGQLAAGAAREQSVR